MFSLDTLRFSLVGFFRPIGYFRQVVEVTTMQKLKFPEVKGKVIQAIELFVSPDECVIDIGFKDRTSLSFDVEACAVIVPELADWKTGEYKPLKRWRRVHSRAFRP